MSVDPKTATSFVVSFVPKGDTRGRTHSLDPRPGECFIVACDPNKSLRDLKPGDKVMFSEERTIEAIIFNG